MYIICFIITISAFIFIISEPEKWPQRIEKFLKEYKFEGK